jgi:hypothetical protein
MTRLLVWLSLAFIASCGGNTTDESSDNSAAKWSIPVNEVIDAGPGRNGIPSLQKPKFILAAESSLKDDKLILGVRYKGITKAYPHNILDWHEVINDIYANERLVLSYCPLTGSGMLWKTGDFSIDPTWGVSGLLYNSNLILYDRDTQSNWSQMLEQSVQGERREEAPQKLKTIEMTWGAWKAMYPETLILSEQTGFERDYSRYPYRSFRTNEGLIFPVSNIDRRLPLKTRVAGIRSSSKSSKVYQIDKFTRAIQVINTDFGQQPIVVIGSSASKFATIYSAKTSDGVTQVFEALTNQLPAVMQDQEGNTWDIFGVAITGPRQGEELVKTESYTAYWYAWAAFFPNAEINF